MASIQPAALAGECALTGINYRAGRRPAGQISGAWVLSYCASRRVHSSLVVSLTSLIFVDG
jgi:hypothetical protein